MSGLVSVVIPCRNEAKHIEGTVRAILSSDYPSLEVLVVDGMSEDGTREVLKRLGEEDPRVRTVDNVKKLTPYAFNLGVQHAAGEYIQIVGSRNVMAPDYLSRLVHVLANRPDVACVGGDYQHVSDSAAGATIAHAMESKFGMGSGNYRTMTDDAFVDTVGVPMYRRTIFNEIGLFDESLTRNQDDEFNFRVRQKNHKIMYVHAAKVTYLVRGSYKKAFWQFFQYGYFKVFVNKKHGAVTTYRQMAPALFLATWAVGLPLSIFIPLVNPLLALILFSYAVAGLALAGKGLSLSQRLQVLITCFILHVGYGSGYWAGIWDFLIVNRTPRTTFQQQTT
ncbi:MAG: glycosyltransferase family 2 protein [Bdellovibrionales bacterium]